MITAQRREPDRATRQQHIFAIQRYAAEQQYYVELNSIMFTTSWQPYGQNYTPSVNLDYGGRAAALWLER